MTRKRDLIRQYLDAVMENRDVTKILEAIEALDAVKLNSSVYVNPEYQKIKDELTKLEAEKPTEPREIAANFLKRTKLIGELKTKSKLYPLVIPEKKKPKVRLSNEEKVEIKENIKDMLKRIYRFKDKTECKSKQRSKPYFTTKEEIIKEIDANPEIKKIVPKNYKSLSKEALCDSLIQDA